MNTATILANLRAARRDAEWLSVQEGENADYWRGKADAYSQAIQMVQAGNHTTATHP